jgi:hypothetical protein
MSQILKSLQLPITGSTSSTPPSGFGVLYASGSNKFFYKNPSGTEFDLLKPNGFINILYYTGSGTGSGVTQTYTWSKPLTGLKYIEVCCVGAGGGGGGGRKSNAPCQGGTGGGGGAIAWATFDANSLASSYQINIGAGGAGGAGATATGNGTTGTPGGTSSFGTLVIAQGGSGGIGGAASTAKQAAGGQGISCTPSGLPYAINGCGGGLTVNVPTNPVNGANPIFDFDGAFGTNDTRPGLGGGGGGCGGSFTGAGGLVSASRGADGYQFNTLIINGGNTGSSGNPGGNATPPTNNMITTLLQFTGSTTLYGLGGGGHGGGVGNAGGNGSNSGLYGAGGGGGGASTVTTAGLPAGTGGSGSSGLCIVVEFY